MRGLLGLPLAVAVFGFCDGKAGAGCHRCRRVGIGDGGAPRRRRVDAGVGGRGVESKDGVHWDCHRGRDPHTVVVGEGCHMSFLGG